MTRPWKALAGVEGLAGVGKALALFAGTAALVWPSPASADLKTNLLAGKIVSASIPGPGVWPGRAMGVVHASAKETYRVLADLTKYNEFIPQIAGAKRLDERAYELRAKFPWPVNETKVKLDVQQGQRGAMYVIKWKMLSGSLKRYEGAAWIQPWGSNRCLVTYQMLAEPRIPAPNALMTNGLRAAAAAVLGAVRKRVTVLTASRQPTNG